MAEKTIEGTTKTAVIPMSVHRELSYSRKILNLKTQFDNINKLFHKITREQFMMIS